MAPSGRSRWLPRAAAAASISWCLVGCSEAGRDRVADLIFEALPSPTAAPEIEAASGTPVTARDLSVWRSPGVSAAAAATGSPNAGDPGQHRSEVPGLIVGRVIDLVTGRGVAGARVAPPAGEAVLADPDGRFELVLPLGSHPLRVTADGHDGATVLSVLAGVTPTALDVGLAPSAVEPHEATVAAGRLRGLLADATLAGASLAIASTAGDQGVSVQAVVEVPATVRVLMPEGDIVEMPMDEYLKGVVPAEMGYVFRRAGDALRAQAIASRTYAATACLADSAGDPARCEPGVDANVDTTTRTQVWRPVHYETSDAAVDATSGQVARYGGELVHALFFARTSGRTLHSEDSRCCGGRAWPYLRSVGSPDAFAERLGHGAGMSQEGAAVFGDWGATADEIVGHYYTGVSVDAARAPTPTAEAAAAEAPADDAPAAAPPEAGAPVRAGSETFFGADLAVTSSARDAADDAWLETPIVEADFPFMALGARWQGAEADRDRLSIEARTSADGEIWSDWAPMPGDEEDLKEAVAPSEAWTQLLLARGRYAQLRLTPGPNSAAAPVDELTVHYLDADEGPAAPTVLEQAIGPAIVSRAAWGADERLRYDDAGREIWPPEYTVPKAQIVHHTVTTNDPADPAAVVRAVYHYHAVSRGWGDVGYNYLIDHRGNVYEGRYGGERGSTSVQGGHALQFNPNTIGVALLGTFTEAASRPSAAAEAALVELLAAKGLRFGIDPYATATLAGSTFADSVLGHRDVLPGHTQCPGDGVHSRLDGIRWAVDQRMDQPDGEPTATTRPPSPVPPSATARPPTATPRPATATRTATRTPLPATVAPSRTPTPTAPPPPSCADLLRDGGFEGPPGAWSLARAYVTEWDVYRGTRALYLGLLSGEEDQGTTYSSGVQTVRVPPRVGQATLRFFARTDGDSGDRRPVRMLDANGAVVALGDFELPAKSAWNAYRVDVTGPLAQRAGQSVRLYFGTINDGEGVRSYVRVDDATLIVCPTAAGTSSATPTARPTATRTATAAASATPRPSGVPGPSATPAAPPPGPVCVDAVRGGGFEGSVADAWSFGGDHRAETVAGGAEGSERSLLLGLLPGDEDRFGYASAAQDLTLPPGTVTATLGLRIFVESASPEDAFVAEVRRTADGGRQPLVGVEALSGGPSWRDIEITWETRALGTEVQLYLATLNRGQGGPSAGRTAVRLDDVRVKVCLSADDASRYMPWSASERP